MITKYYCRDDKGRDLFFVSLHVFGPDEPYFLDTSLGIDVKSLPGIHEMVEAICRKEYSDESRITLINTLFAHLQVIPGIEAKFLPDYALDKHGRFNEPYLRILHQVISEVEFPDYTPFAENYNAFYFERIKPQFAQLLVEGKLTRMPQKQFVELLPMNPKLQELFVEYLAVNMAFYTFSEWSESAPKEYWGCYLMVSENELAFLFARQIQ